MEKCSTGDKAPHNVPSLQERLSGKLSSCSTIFNSSLISRASLVVSGIDVNGNVYTELILVVGDSGHYDLQKDVKAFTQAIFDKFYASLHHPSTQGK